MLLINTDRSDCFDYYAYYELYCCRSEREPALDFLENFKALNQKNLFDVDSPSG